MKNRTPKAIRIETFLVGRPWNNLLIVRITADNGLTGLGEGTMQWQAKTVETAVVTLFRRYVIGNSVFEIERLVQAMYRNEYARGGPVLNSAIAAIEMALWDICGKHLGRPVHDLLGGRVRDSMPAYANGWTGAGKDPDDLHGAAREVVAQGFTALKFDPFWALGRDPATADIRRGMEKVAVVRDAVGPDVDILVDGHGRFSIGTAIDVGRRLADYDVYWFEEPVDPENAQALAKVGRSIPVRLATGERCYSRYHVPQLLAASEVAILQPDPIQVGGILESRKIAAIADSAYVTVSFHSPFGPVATAAALQIDACTTNVWKQESFSAFDVPWRQQLVRNCPMPNDGSYAISSEPGLGGIELNDEVAREHPYREEGLESMWQENGGMTAWLDTLM
ncbi:mandelate racemase/muconate lactonizing enzyme family protein [Neorhizobium sp. P12A]|uniref:mandelate racemase/muconate lactonizing enzyme family protein n=1 Tax=Neorhizobium sp. P12A TaxID=2268027 RepID=UPI00139E92FC|nr:mandelate racemase/muconate lactonizing enzyme family protein [Neorhizobium sp. P12A]KAA0691968.1 mandelate racemase/muconate lactonizing enzyme family protein [Neorhizobium sp. P12A]